jgi:hypothetical protein
MDIQMVPAQEPVMTARADLVAILEELRDVLVQLDLHAVDARYVDFGEMANRLEECIGELRELPDAP